MCFCVALDHKKQSKKMFMGCKGTRNKLQVERCLVRDNYFPHPIFLALGNLAHVFSLRKDLLVSKGEAGTFVAIDIWC